MAKFDFLENKKSFWSEIKKTFFLVWQVLSFRLEKQTSTNVADTTFKSYGISGQIFGLISSFRSNRGLWVVMDGKSSQEYPFNAGVLQGSILGPTFFLLYINDLCDDVICNIAIYADDIPSIRSLIRHLICGNNLNWLLNLIYETLDWC